MADGNEVRRENRGHGNAGAQAHTTALNDSLIIVPIDDGTHGHYCLVPLPALDPNDPALKTALAVGLKYDAIRAGQAEAKKAAKVTGATPATISAALAAWSTAYKPEANGDRVDTIGSKRVEIAAPMLKELLVKMGKFPTPEAVNDATVAANMPGYLKKFGPDVETALAAWIAAGYQPKRKGETAKADDKAGAVVVDFE